jgi:hypothetical protein
MASSAFIPGALDEGRGTRKLTVEQVLEARLRYAEGERELSKLIREYGVGRQSVQSAAVGQTYKDLPMPPKRLQGELPAIPQSEGGRWAKPG